METDLLVTPELWSASSSYWKRCWIVPDAAIVPMFVIFAVNVVGTVAVAEEGDTTEEVRSGWSTGGSLVVTVVHDPLQLLPSFDSVTVPAKEVLLSAHARMYFVPAVVKV